MHSLNSPDAAVHPRDHIRLSRTLVRPDGSEHWCAWEAGLDARRAATCGPPDLRAAAHLAEQERVLFGHVRTRALIEALRL